MLNMHVQKVVTAVFEDMTEQVKRHRSPPPPSILLSLRMLYEYNITNVLYNAELPPFYSSKHEK